MGDATADEWSCPSCGSRYPGEFALCPRDATPRAAQAATSADPLIGAVLGHTYRITRALAEGGMARVYEAEHLRIDARFAIKVIHDSLTGHADLLARFEREARAATRMRSDHIVRLVDVLPTADGRPCLVTELLEGEDLQQRLDRDRKLTIEQAIPIARQICRAMADAHAAGVVHRDLKPSNVFLCRRDGVPLVKVVDFGIAKLDDDDRLTRTGAVMGTLAYMAPEQARRAVDASALADVYSMGCILYHMVTGEPPYGNLPAVSRFALLLQQEPARPRSIEPTIPEGFEAVIQHAMARDRDSRIASAAELDARIAAFDVVPAEAPKRPSTAPAASPETTAVAIARRARIARPIAALLAVLATLATGAWAAALLTSSFAPKTHGERVLIALIALAAAIGVALVQVRGLHREWSSTPAVTRHTRPVARALGMAVITLGTLELATYGARAVLHAEPLGIAARLAITGLAAALVVVFERFSVMDRWRRRIG